ncbi:hypothetical protein [Chryseobacterium sp. GP-SGM7]|uniref:hypothetical protein n=1 Tax=Chryseobacterium sp. GP-SGM7 TaxID=3411323 RepID=UPI003B94DE0E
MRVFRGLLVALLFLICAFSYAQEGFGNNTSSVITLTDGVTVYSSDQNFNKQIKHKHVGIDNAEIVIKRISEDKEILIAKTFKNPFVPGKKLKNKPKENHKNFQRDNIKAIKKHIAEYESRKGSFEWIDYKVFPSSEKFIMSSHINQDYVVPNFGQHNFSDADAHQNQYIVKSALDFLHSQKYRYYNNKSLDFCFSQVFSVRPPPFGC